MTDSWRGLSGQASESWDRPGPAAGTIKVVSWNLLRLVGAGVEDVAALIEQHRPDLLLMQEATEDLAGLPAIVGGHFHREPLHGRVYGLAAWSPHPFPRPHAMPLPVSTMPGRVPPRLAQIVRFNGITFANVHLSHGQFLNRWQLLHVVRSLDGPAAVIGDYNAVGPIKLSGFKDIGPREPTHSPGSMISFRLDRCMARGLDCMRAQVLQRGPSDHHPIVLELNVTGRVAEASESIIRRMADIRLASVQGRVEHWLRAVSQSSNRIRVPLGFAESLKFRKAARRSAQRSRHKSAGADVQLGSKERARP